MTKQIYGQLLSRAGRANWAAHECGIDFEHVDVPTGASIEQKPAKLVAVNPAGTIPTYVDADFVMTESFAIGLYLARKYKPALMGDSLEEEGKVYQWTLFAATDLEKAALEMINNSGYDAGHPLDAEKLQAGREKVGKILAEIEQGARRPRLSGRQPFHAGRPECGLSHRVPGSVVGGSQRLRQCRALAAALRGAFRPSRNRCRQNWWTCFGPK